MDQDSPANDIFGQDNPPEYWYAPVFTLNHYRFAWFDRAMVAETPEGAKKIGQKLEEGYIKNNVPIQAAKKVAKFKTVGNYALAELGPEGEEKPVVVLNPAEIMPDETDDNGVRPETPEEIEYDLITTDTFVKSVRF